MKVEQLLKTIELWRVANPPKVVVSKGTMLTECIQMMKERRTGACLVVENNKLCGIFTERDVLKKVHLNRVSLKESVDSFMTANPKTLPKNTALGKAIQELIQGGFRHLPVVDDNNRPIGMVFVRGIVDYIAEHFPNEVYNLPPEMQTFTSQEGA
ncbi:MAG: CBS domain-containing protein [Leptospiraceae bacterium]|nr:CBS domain-containing protein [Leptospiraceae bacterium]